MRLTNKVSNVFFSLMGLLSIVFMPVIAYSAALVGSDSFSIYNLIVMAKDSTGTGSFSEILSSFATYGYKSTLLLIIAGFAAAIICMLAIIVLAFIKKIPYIVSAVLSAISLAGAIVADVFLGKLCRGIVSGTLPLSVFTSKQNQSFLQQLFGAFTGVRSANVSYGLVIAIIAIAVMLLINIVFFIFRKKIAELDGEKPEEKKKKSKKTKKA